MAQTKKDVVKTSIDNAALKIFSKKGFQDARIMDIAAEANTSVGNIYRYYKSKTDIFYSVVPESIISDLQEILVRKIVNPNVEEILKGGALKTSSLISEEFIDFLITNKQKLSIAFQGSQGTKYVGIKEKTIFYIIQTVKNRYLQMHRIDILERVSYEDLENIYENLFSMIMNTLVRSKSNEDIKKSLQIINQYNLFGITSLFK